MLYLLKDLPKAISRGAGRTKKKVYSWIIMLTIDITLFYIPTVRKEDLENLTRTGTLKAVE